MALENIKMLKTIKKAINVICKELEKMHYSSPLGGYMLERILKVQGG